MNNYVRKRKCPESVYTCFWPHAFASIAIFDWQLMSRIRFLYLPITPSVSRPNHPFSLKLQVVVKTTLTIYLGFNYIVISHSPFQPIYLPILLWIYPLTQLSFHTYTHSIWHIHPFTLTSTYPPVPSRLRPLAHPVCSSLFPLHPSICSHLRSLTHFFFSRLRSFTHPPF